MFTHIVNLVPQAMRKKGIHRQAQAALVCEKFRQIGAHLLPPEIYEQIRPQSYKNRILTIAVAHPIYAAELNNFKHDLMKSLNEALDKQNAVASIRTVVGNTIGDCRVESDEIA